VLLVVPAEIAGTASTPAVSPLVPAAGTAARGRTVARAAGHILTLADGAGLTLVSMNWSGLGVVSRHRIVADGHVRFVTPPSDT
jgi:hypothetical protein